MKNTQQQFLQTLFPGEGYGELEMNGFWLVRQRSGNTGETSISIYTKVSFERYKTYQSANHKTRVRMDKILGGKNRFAIQHTKSERIKYAKEMKGWRGEGERKQTQETESIRQRNHLKEIMRGI